MPKLRKIALWVLMISIIFPLIYLYYWLNYWRPEKSNLIPYADSISKLGEQIKNTATEKKLKGYISAVNEIEGPEDILIKQLKVDINTILAGYPGWKIVVTEEERKKIVEKINIYLKRMPTLKNPDIVIASMVGERMPNYFTECNWNFLPGSKNTCQINCLIIDSASKSTLINVTENFTHPKYYTHAKMTEKIVKFGTYISAGVFGLSLLFFIISDSIIFVKRRKIRQMIPLTMEKLEEYIQGGAYTAADSLVCQQLDYLPENTDFIGFKARLMVVTKNNSAQAEHAYIRYINLRVKLQQGVPLSEEEFEDLKKLPQYLELPEITEMIAKYEKFIKSFEVAKQLKSKHEYIRMLLESGELSKAQFEIDSLYRDTSWNEYKALSSTTDDASHLLQYQCSLDSFENLRTEAEQKLKVSKENFDKAKALISAGSIGEAEKILKEVVETNKELKEAQEILNKIDKSRKTEKLVLKAEKIGKEINIFKKDTITLARKDKITPDIDINNPRISRDHHLKLCIIENNVIAEDENSANGTRHCGEKMTRAQIEDGDIIDIANTYKITVHICRGREIVKSTLVSSTIPSEMKIDHRDILDHQKISGLFIEAEDRNFIVLPSSLSSPSQLMKEVRGEGVGQGVPIAFKSVGIVYEKSGDCQIAINNNVLLLSTPDGCQILCHGEQIDYHGIKYKLVI
jgi:tetratricopeptide (TPR) repeat protein